MKIETLQPSKIKTRLFTVIFLFLISSFFVLASGFFLLASSVKAASDIDLEINPAVEFVSVLPGGKLQHTITIKQNGTTPLSVTPTIVDFKADGETGNPILSDTTHVDFISIENKDVNFGKAFNLTSEQSKQIVFNIHPNGDQIESEFPLTILFRAQAQNENQHGSGALSSAMIGANLIVHVSPNLENSGKLEVENIRSSKIFDSFRPLNFQILIKNTGNNATVVNGQVKVYDWQNKEILNESLAPDLILANSTRLARYSPSEKKTTKEPDYSQLSSQFSYSSPFLIGPYTIEVALNDPVNQIEESFVLKTHVVAFPISIMLIILFSFNTYLAYRYLVAKD